MLLQTTDPIIALTTPKNRRYKRLARRLARDARVAGPFIAVALETVVIAATIVIVERAVSSDYFPTIPSSSTSNVSAAPPGMPPGEPLSP